MPNEISLIPKEYKEKAGFGAVFSKMGILIFVLLIFAILVYGGLFFYGRSLNNQSNELQKNLEDLNKKRDIAFEKEVISLEKTLKSLKTALKNHIYWSALFAKFEKLTVPQVSFSKFNGELKDDGSPSLLLKGKTSGYSYLAKQMVVLANDPLVSDIKVVGISLGTEGGIDFSLSINFVKDILLKQK